MTAPNTDKPLSASNDKQGPEGGEQEGSPHAMPRVGQPKTEDWQLLRPLFSALRSLKPILRRPSVLWLGAAPALCLMGVIVLIRGCEGRAPIRPTPQMGIESRFWVRVLLLDNVAECIIEVPSAFRLAPAESAPGAQADEPAMEPLPEPAKIGLADGRLVLGATPLAGQEVTLCPEQPYIFGLNGQKYRGWLKLVVGPDGRSFDAVNLVPLEPYLAGVVGEEMPRYWEPQALKAQAIAARTYCLFVKNRFGTGRSYDVKRTQSSQVYGGIGAESVQIWDAVNSTCGQVLIAPELMAKNREIADFGLRPRIEVRGDMIADSTRGANPQSAINNPQSCGLFPAYYGSSCGGHTTSSEEVFGDSFGPLKGVPCPYCKDVAKWELFHWPAAAFDRATVTKRLIERYPNLESLGEITDLTAIEESCYGSYSRLRRIRLTGATGKTDTLRAEDLRLALDPSGRKIRSTMCLIVPSGDGWAFVSGRGWGHGVGMCQCGAEGMARLGSDVQSILRYYYPGAEIVNVY
jgi:stage II sporulation protein D